MPKQWNSVWAGREAFTAIDGKGYRHGSFDRRYVRLHRVLWALAYGEWPAREVDHIDGNRLNNCLGNLRLATASENHRNQKKRADSTSGVTGVSWHKRSGRWRAYVTAGGRMRHLGYFDSLEEAATARAEADKIFDFHDNHGKR